MAFSGVGDAGTLMRVLSFRPFAAGEAAIYRLVGSRPYPRLHLIEREDVLYASAQTTSKLFDSPDNRGWLGTSALTYRRRRKHLRARIKQPISHRAVCSHSVSVNLVIE